MYGHCLAMAADYKTLNLGTIRPLKHHAAADPDVLKGCFVSLLLQILQALNDKPVQRLNVVVCQ
jgi:ATP adenylyltransferase/5',5'''-P-1,P-4-tetraphosphate phosphorylase II